MIAHYDPRRKRSRERITTRPQAKKVVDLQTLFILAILTVAVVLLLAFLSTQQRGESILSRAVSTSPSTPTVWNSPQSTHPTDPGGPLSAYR